MRARTPVAPPRPALLLIADAPTVGAERAREAVAAVLARVPGPLVAVVDRDRDPARGGASDRARLARLEVLRGLTAAVGAALFVTGRADLASAVGADGVQLPERGLPVEAARGAFPGLLFGRSCHDRAGLLAAAAAGAGWATLAPVRAPWSKPTPSGPPLGVDGFRRAIAGAGLPVYALGGIGPDLVAGLADAGAAGVATIGGVFGQADPAAAAAALLAPWSRPRGSRPGG